MVILKIPEVHKEIVKV